MTADEAQQIGAAPAIKLGAPAPEFRLPDTTGVIRASAEYLGAPLVVVLTRHVH